MGWGDLRQRVWTLPYGNEGDVKIFKSGERRGHILFLRDCSSGSIEAVRRQSQKKED